MDIMLGGKMVCVCGYGEVGDCNYYYGRVCLINCGEGGILSSISEFDGRNYALRYAMVGIRHAHLASGSCCSFIQYLV